MIVEWIVNALIMLIKAPISLLELPNFDIEGQLANLEQYLTAGYTLIRWLTPDPFWVILLATLSVLALSKVFDLVSTVIGFFKSKAGEKN